MLLFVEGIDGTGKTTLCNNLNRHYKNSFLKRFPDSPLREVIAKTENREALIFLLLADQTIGYSQISNNSELVICDRSWISTMVYQLPNIPQTKPYLSTIIKDAINYNFPKPDMVLFLRSDTVLAAQRSKKRISDNIMPEDSLKVEEFSKYLNSVQNDYEKVITRLQLSSSPNVKTIDISRMTEQGVAELSIKYIDAYQNSVITSV